MMDCKHALTEAKGDLEKAIVVLRKKGIAAAAKKASARSPAKVLVGQLHSRRRQNRRARGSQLRERLRGPHRRLQGTGARHRHAHRRQRSAIRAQEDVTPEAFEREKDIYRAQATPPASRSL